MEKVLVFDIWGEYGHFKKPYTTTSPITYSIPARTTLAGMIGAIIGIEKNEVNSLLNPEKSNIALSIINPIKKTIISQNLIDTKKAKQMAKINGRTQIRFEYLKNVKYRIYYSGADYEKLKGHLENHTSEYTLSLGLSECLANYKYIGEHEIEKKIGNCQLTSVLNSKNILPENIDFSCGGEIFSDRFAREMKEDREVLEYSDLIFERRGKTIGIKNSEYYCIEKLKENIIFI